MKELFRLAICGTIICVMMMCADARPDEGRIVLVQRE